MRRQTFAYPEAAFRRTTVQPPAGLYNPASFSKA